MPICPEQGKMIQEILDKIKEREECDRVSISARNVQRRVVGEVENYW